MSFGNSKHKEFTSKSQEKMKKKTDWYHVTLAFFLSVLSWPLVRILDVGFRFIDKNDRPLWMMATGFIMMGVVSWIAFKCSKVKDWVYFVITMFAFTGVIDLIIFLEFKNILSKFMYEYLSVGEPYLFSAWGAAICAFDGIAFYPMYLGIIFLHTNNKSFRSLGIYWITGILNSMFVLVLGIFSGKHSPTPCTFLNIPYVVVPILLLIRITSEQNVSKWQSNLKASLTLKVLDFGLILGNLLSVAVILSKSLALLGSNYWMVKGILLSEFEFLQADHNDPAPFFPLQILVFLFYILPVQLLSIYYLFQNHKPQVLWYVTIAQAGILIQAQFTNIFYALDYKQSNGNINLVDETNIHFWLINLLIVIMPHLMLLRLVPHRTAITIGKDKSKSK